MSSHRPDPDPLPISTEALYTALVDAFPTFEGLQRMVSFGLDENLEGIAGTGALNDVTYQLVRWARTQGRMLDLLHGAVAANAGNVKLRSLRAQVDGPPARDGDAPYLPSLILGREHDLTQLKLRLGIPSLHPRHPFTAIHGWPGVGKTTLLAALVADPDIAQAYPDGLLWTSLGPEPNLFGALAAWGRQLGLPELDRVTSLEALSERLKAALRLQRRLLIVDDVWEADHARPFQIAGSQSALLVTTRDRKIAQTLAPLPSDVYLLKVLPDPVALDLLRTLAPQVVAETPDLSLALVQDLEGLPLGIQVAGRLLHSEASYGFGVTDLVAAIRAGKTLLEAQAPPDRTTAGPLTVTALLQTSTDRLDPDTRDRFAYLGAFAPKPATFDEAALQAVWEVADARPTIRTLVDRGLLEPLGGGRFWLHALLKMHAESLLED